MYVYSGTPLSHNCKCYLGSIQSKGIPFTGLAAQLVPGVEPSAENQVVTEELVLPWNPVL